MNPALPDPAPSLEDLLHFGLDIVFVGINPSIYSAERGHYFARVTNRFWPCLSRSNLSQAARAGLGVERLGPQHDADLPEYGIGFTDVVKLRTKRATDVAPAELVAGVELLVAKLDRYQPRIACFHGVTNYRPVHRVLTSDRDAIMLGPQDVRERNPALSGSESERRKCALYVRRTDSLVRSAGGRPRMTPFRAYSRGLKGHYSDATTSKNASICDDAY